MGEVLRRAAQHRRPADVDHLDRLLLADAVLARDLLERVQVDADEVEQLDPVLGERGQVGLDLAAGEDAGVDARVERLDPAAEHLRELGQAPRRSSPAARARGSSRRCRRSRRAPSRARRAPSRACRGRSCRTTEISARTALSRPPAAAGARRRGSARSASRAAGRGRGSWRITAPVSSPSSTRCTVTPVVSHAGGERVVDRARARELGQQRGMDVDDPLREALEERRREQVHVAGADDEAHALLLEPVRHRRVALLAVGVVGQLEGGRGNARRARALERPRARRGSRRRRTTGNPASSSACRFEPSPLTRTPITLATIRPITRSSPGSATTAQ